MSVNDVLFIHKLFLEDLILWLWMVFLQTLWWLWSHCWESVDHTFQHRRADELENIHWKSGVRHYLLDGEASHGFQGTIELLVRFFQLFTCWDSSKCTGLYVAWANGSCLWGTQAYHIREKSTIWRRAQGKKEIITTNYFHH